MIELDNFQDAIKEIESRISQNGIKIISLDGNTGSGKSTLAKYISDKTGAIHLDLDEEKYLHQNQGGRLKYIKYDILHDDIIELINLENLVIVDSVCILKILKIIKIESDLKIYVKRLSAYGHWYESNKFDYQKSASEIIQEEKNRAQILRDIVNSSVGTNEHNEIKENTTYDEIIEYHFEYKPDINADIVYNRFMDNN